MTRLTCHGRRQLRQVETLLSLALGAAACGPESPSPSDEAHLQVSVIERSTACQTCSLEITYLGRLGTSADTMLMTSGTMIAVRSDGAFIAAPLSVDGEAAIFDSPGAVARAYGRFGDGPGENGRILNVLPWRGDSMLFAGFDRLTFLAGPQGAGRTSRLERPSPSHRTAALPAADAIVRNYSYPPDPQFVVFGADGRIQARLGEQAQPGTRQDIYRVLAELGPARDPHRFWSAPQRYRIAFDLWDARDGTQVRRFEDTTSWYSPYDSTALYQFVLDGNDVESPPPPFLRGIRETRDGVLMLLYNVPARDWQRTTDTLPPMQRGMRQEAYDGVIDLRDPNSGASLLAVRTNIPFARLVNDTLLADRRQTEEGFWVYDVYRMKFRR